MPIWSVNEAMTLEEYLDREILDQFTTSAYEKLGRVGLKWLNKYGPATYADFNGPWLDKLPVGESKLYTYSWNLELDVDEG